MISAMPCTPVTSSPGCAFTDIQRLRSARAEHDADADFLEKAALNATRRACATGRCHHDIPSSCRVESLIEAVDRRYRHLGRCIGESDNAFAKAQQPVGIAACEFGLVEDGRARPCPASVASRRSRRMTSSEASGSRLATGSSASSACGRCASARAMEARCACPPESVLAR